MTAATACRFVTRISDHSHTRTQEFACPRRTSRLDEARNRPSMAMRSGENTFSPHSMMKREGGRRRDVAAWGAHGGDESDSTEGCIDE